MVAVGSHPARGSVFSHTVLSCYVPAGVAGSRLWRDISCLKGQRTWMKTASLLFAKKNLGKGKLYIYSGMKHLKYFGLVQSSVLRVK